MTMNNAWVVLSTPAGMADSRKDLIHEIIIYFSNCT